MRQPRRILCPVDFSEPSTIAYRHALSLARHYRAKLFVQRVFELWRHPHLGFAATGELFARSCTSLLAREEETLQRFVKASARDGVELECVLRQGNARDHILDFAEAEDVDLIVMGTHGRRGLDRLLLGSVTERVMRKAPCPVLAVNKPSRSLAASDTQPSPVRLRRILFSTDLSEHSQFALMHALSLRAEYDCELTLLHIVERIPHSIKGLRTLAAARKRLHSLISVEEGKAGKIDVLVRAGKPYRQIIQLASETQPDVVIMAVCGRSALDLAVFGSTTRRVLQLGPCPVFVFPV